MNQLSSSKFTRSVEQFVALTKHTKFDSKKHFLENYDAYCKQVENMLYFGARDTFGQ